MQLDQIYHDATNAFQNDPELRNLLMATMNQATSDGGLPAIMQQPNVGSSDRQMNPALLAQIAQQRSNVAAKGPMGPMAGAPAMPPGLIPQADQPRMVKTSVEPGMPQGAISNPQMAQVAAGMPQRGPSPAAAEPGMGAQIAAFLSGLGKSDAILPAIGGGMQAVQDLERSGQQRNLTVRALMNRGMDAETAAAAASNPEILKAILPGLFSSGKKQLGEIYGPDGSKQKIFHDEHGNFDKVGEPSRDPGTSALSRVQATANVKRVETYKNEAKNAQEMLGNLNQLEQLRKDTSYEGYPMGISQVIAVAGDITGMSRGRAINPLALNIQLGFTEKTKGAITDREMAMFAGAVPGLNMGDHAAQPVLAGMKAAAQRKIEEAKFYEAYLNAHKGSLEGAQDSWDAYKSANPIIQQNPDGTLTVNQKNIGNWRDYVGDRDSDPRVNAGPASGDVNLEPREPDNLPGAGGTSGFSDAVKAAPRANPTPTAAAPSQAAPAEARKNFPVVTSDEEYKALKKGTVYIYEGNEYTKR